MLGAGLAATSYGRLDRFGQGVIDQQNAIMAAKEARALRQQKEEEAAAREAFVNRYLFGSNGRNLPQTGGVTPSGESSSFTAGLTGAQAPQPAAVPTPQDPSAVLGPPPQTPPDQTQQMLPGQATPYAQDSQIGSQGVNMQQAAAQNLAQGIPIGQQQRTLGVNLAPDQRALLALLMKINPNAAVSAWQTMVGQQSAFSMGEDKNGSFVVDKMGSILRRFSPQPRLTTIDDGQYVTVADFPNQRVYARFKKSMSPNEEANYGLGQARLDQSAAESDSLSRYRDSMLQNDEERLKLQRLSAENTAAYRDRMLKYYEDRLSTAGQKEAALKPIPAKVSEDIGNNIEALKQLWNMYRNMWAVFGKDGRVGIPLAGTAQQAYDAIHASNPEARGARYAYSYSAEDLSNMLTRVYFGRNSSDADREAAKRLIPKPNTSSERAIANMRLLSEKIYAGTRNAIENYYGKDYDVMPTLMHMNRLFSEMPGFTEYFQDMLPQNQGAQNGKR
jgi:hypothetical protein